MSHIISYATSYGEAQYPRGTVLLYLFSYTPKTISFIRGFVVLGNAVLWFCFILALLLLLLISDLFTSWRNIPVKQTNRIVKQAKSMFP